MAMIPYTLLTQGLYSGVITSISTMTCGMCNVIKSIYKYQNPDAINHIKRLDIEYHIKLISLIVKKYTISNTTDIKERINNKSLIFTTINDTSSKITDPIQLSLLYLSIIIKDIHSDLIAINKKVAYHNTKFFNSWRTLDIKSNLETLENNNNILKERLDIFLKLHGTLN